MTRTNNRNRKRTALRSHNTGPCVHKLYYTIRLVYTKCKMQITRDAMKFHGIKLLEAQGYAKKKFIEWRRHNARLRRKGVRLLPMPNV